MMSTSPEEESATLVAAPSVAAEWNSAPSPPLLGGYILGERLAVGGMGSVHFGIKTGALGFQRVVAIKRLHAHLSEAPDSVARFTNEIRLVSRLSHPNLVQTFDVIETEGELVLIMEYVDGETLHALLQDANAAGVRLPVPVAVGILSQALHGLHAAHEATDDEGRRLNLVHRDVSPQNVMIDKDGLVKVLDFGVAKATTEWHVTRTGEVSGKIAYMSPEQADARPIDQRSDVFAAGVVLWETLTGERLFRPQGATDTTALLNVLDMRVPPPSDLNREVGPALDRIALRALERVPARRFGSARDFALALEDACPNASVSAVASELAGICGARVFKRTERLRQLQADLRRFSLFGASPSEPVRYAPTRESDPCTTRESDPYARARDAISLGTFQPEHSRGGPSATDPEAELRTRDMQGVLLAKASPPSRSREVWIRLTLGLASTLLLAWFAVHVAFGLGSSPAASSAPRASVPSVPRVDPMRSKKVPASPAPITASAPPIAGSSAAAEPTARATGSAAPSTRRVRRPRSTRVDAPGVSATCSPPSYVDADGIRHFKPECL